MFSGVFRLGDRRVDALMTPRTDLEWIDIEDDQNTIIHALNAQRVFAHSGGQRRSG
jgi:putative hemolysin